MNPNLPSSEKLRAINFFTGKLSLLIIACFFCNGVSAFGLPVHKNIVPHSRVHNSQAAAPVITASAVKGSIISCAGMPSGSPYIQLFTFSGSNLSAGITITAPAGFEVSLSAASGYQTNVAVSPAGDVINSTVVYVRSSASATPGNISGNVTLTSGGAAGVNVSVRGIVNALPIVKAVSNQTVANGATTAAVQFSGTGNILNWVNDTPGIGLAGSGTGDIPSFAAVNSGVKPVTATITIVPSFSGFLYVADAGTKSAPAHSVSVINTTTNAIVATVQVGNTPVGVAVSPDGSRVYVSNSGSNSVSVIGTQTNTVMATIPVGNNPYGITISPDGSKVFVANTGSNNVSVINAVNHSVIGTIAVDQGPTGVAMSPDGNRLYVTNLGAATVSMINTSTNVVIATIKTGKSARGTAISPDGNRLYVTNFNDTTVTLINTKTNTVTALIPVGKNPAGLSVSPDGRQLYVADQGQNVVSVVNTASNQVVATIPVGGQPFGVSVSSNDDRAYVTNSATNTISVISTTTNTVIATVAGGSGPASFGNFVYEGSGCSGIPITFTITVNPPPVSSNANLASLKLSSGVLSPVFSSGVTAYTTSVGNDIASISLTPTASDAKANIKIDGTNVTTGSASQDIPLKIGSNTVTVVLTAQDGVSTKTYKVTVTRAVSGNAALSSLKISTGTLSPAFLSNTKSYTVEVPYTTSSVTVTPTVADATATVKVIGNAAVSGVATAPIGLAVGLNTINTVVTAQNGSTTITYTIALTRQAPSSNDFLNSIALSQPFEPLTIVSGPGFKNYTASVSNTTTSVSVVPVAVDANATIKVNGVAVQSTSVSQPVNLTIGANTITALVTAQDQVSTKSYIITVTRASAPSNIADELVSVEQSSARPQFATNGVTVHQGLSPNGDGINDFLKIDGLEAYPDNKLTIMNRNGSTVFEAKGYDNSTKVFDGHSNKTGSMQLPGTYFYSLDYTVQGVTTHKTGVIVIKY